MKEFTAAIIPEKAAPTALPAALPAEPANAEAASLKLDPVVKQYAAKPTALTPNIV